MSETMSQEQGKIEMGGLETLDDYHYGPAISTFGLATRWIAIKLAQDGRYEGGKWVECLGINEIMFVVEGVRRRSGERCQSRNGKVQMMTTGWKREKRAL